MRHSGGFILSSPNISIGRLSAKWPGCPIHWEIRIELAETTVRVAF
jgi:hypothetical protein